jgi:hypothetical protein
VGRGRHRPPAEHRILDDFDGQITLAPDAEDRGGVQPIAHATANGDARAEVKVGETVTLVGTALQPPGTGTIVAAEWDFASFRVGSHRDGIHGKPPFARNNARVRIVVTD